MPDIEWHMDGEPGREEVSLRDVRNHVSEVLRRVETISSGLNLFRAISGSISHTLGRITFQGEDHQATC